MTWWAVLAAVLAAVILIRIIFSAEIKACFERDPAARNLVEVLLAYPGLHALIGHRLAHGLDRLHVPVVPRVLMGLVRWVTGIEIHPAATIGPGLFIDHGMGVVIGETTVIGKNVTLFQGVTLGGNGKERGKRHPTLGDNVVVGTGAQVLGNIVIGNDSMIGANAVVIREVPPHSTVVGVPGRIAKIKGQNVPGTTLDHTHLPDPLSERLAVLQQEIDAIEAHLKQARKSEPPHSS